MAVKIEKKAKPTEVDDGDVPFSGGQNVASDDADATGDDPSGKEEGTDVPATPVTTSTPVAKKAVKKAKKAKDPPQTKVQVTADSSVVHSHTGTVHEQHEVISELVESEPMANVGMSTSYTKNLGNYENLKFHVSLHVPCANNPESIEAAFEFVEKWVEGKMTRLVAEAEESAQED